MLLLTVQPVDLFNYPIGREGPYIFALLHFQSGTRYGVVLFSWASVPWFTVPAWTAVTSDSLNCATVQVQCSEPSKPQKVGDDIISPCFLVTTADPRYDSVHLFQLEVQGMTLHFTSTSPTQPTFQNVTTCCHPNYSYWDTWWHGIHQLGRGGGGGLGVEHFCSMYSICLMTCCNFIFRGVVMTTRIPDNKHRTLRVPWSVVYVCGESCRYPVIVEDLRSRLFRYVIAFGIKMHRSTWIKGFVSYF